MYIVCRGWVKAKQSEQTWTLQGQGKLCCMLDASSQDYCILHEEKFHPRIALLWHQLSSNQRQGKCRVAKEWSHLMSHHTAENETYTAASSHRLFFSLPPPPVISSSPRCPVLVHGPPPSRFPTIAARTSLRPPVLPWPRQTRVIGGSGYTIV